MPTDPAIERVQSGDRDAFDTLCRDHQDFVTRLVVRLLGRHEEIEDVVQEVFIQVHRSIGNFRGESKFTTWLYRLTTNVVRMHLRRKRSRPVLVAESGAEVPDISPSPQEWVEVQERVDAFYRLLERLTEKKRTVLVLHDVEGLPAAQIAEIVEAPILTVRTRLFYARKELYALMHEEPALASLVAAYLQPLEARS